MDTLYLYNINLSINNDVHKQLTNYKFKSLREGRDKQLYNLNKSYKWNMIEYLNVSTIRMERNDIVDVSIPTLPTNLRAFDCSYTSDIQTIPKIPDKCKVLVCSSCRSLKELPELSKSLRYIDCSFCIGIKRINDMNINLTYFNCLNIPLKYLPKFREGLRVLKISLIHGSDLSNGLPDSIEELTWKGPCVDHLPKNTRIFNCNNGLLDELPDLTTGKLEILECSGNLLTEIDNLPNTLKELSCNYNKLKTIGMLPNSLEKLLCHHNELKLLPALNENLKMLSCSYNKLTCLPSFTRNLEKVYCHKNNLMLIPRSIINCDYLSKMSIDKSVIIHPEIKKYIENNNVSVDKI